jgi:glycerophosphoryl diester phosphodiesterase
MKAVQLKILRICLILAAFQWINAQPGPICIAHRGGRSLAPENTLAAIRAGLQSQTDFIEIDVHQTLDSVVVLSHDETLDRCTDGHGRIDKTSFAEIKKLDAGSWFGAQYAGEKVPTLEEALDLIHGHCRLWI